jgi:hypothetical protein
MNTRVIKWGFAALVIVFIFLLVSVYIERPEEETREQVPVVMNTAAPSLDLSSYEDPAGAYSIMYPKEYVAVMSSDSALFRNGVSFLVPETLTEGTNLSKDSRIYIEAKNATSTCVELVARFDVAAAPGSMEETVTFGNNKYRVVSYSEAGAGNFYETDVYAIGKGTACYEVTRFIHSTNIGNYDPGTVKAFDRVALDASMKIVLESFDLK